MNLQNLKEYLQILVGKTLEDVNLACEMIMFTFGNVDIHAQCFTRIIYKNNVLLTTLDYQNWDGVTDTNNDEWFNLSQNKDKLIGNKAVKVEFTEINDLYIGLDNGVCIQIFTSNGQPHYAENCEQWRVFDNTDEIVEHIIVYSDAIKQQKTDNL